jgi:tRNA(Ile)-lysidine synthase
MKSLPEKVRLTIKRYNMLLSRQTVLIGLSGGPDSVCLLHILSGLKEEMSLSLYAAYIDHGLRPLDLPGEIQFCKELCERLSVPLKIRAINVKEFAVQKGLSKQEAARQLRYQSLQEIAQEVGASRIALGHNADDQVETFFINILRGTGPKGLSGIPPVRANIIRPLIEIERREIEEFLDKNGINYIIDPSNLKDIYLRNRLRHKIIPELKRINPSLTETMIRSMRILREEEGYFDIIVTKTLMRLISSRNSATERPSNGHLCDSATERQSDSHIDGKILPCKKLSHYRTDARSHYFLSHRRTNAKEGRIELFLSPMEAIDIVILRRVFRRVIDKIMGLREVSFRHIEDILELVTKGRSGDRLYLPEGVRIIKGYSTLIITTEPPVRIGNYILSIPGEVLIKETGVRIKAEILSEQQMGSTESCRPSEVESSQAAGISRNINIFLPRWIIGFRLQAEGYRRMSGVRLPVACRLSPEFKGDLKMKCPFFYKISPGPSFPKRGIMELTSLPFKNCCCTALPRYCAIFDADKVSSTLTIRPRQKGDFFYPMGFGKRKKLQDFFVDEKVPRDERDSIPVVLSGSDIIWIAGLRADERFKVREGTRRFLRLRVDPE